MTKKDLIDAVYERALEVNIDLTKREAEDVIEAVFDIFAKELAEQGKQAFPGFGTFTKKHRKARQGRNPKNGEAIEIPASNTVSFKPAPTLKDRLN